MLEGLRQKCRRCGKDMDFTFNVSVYFQCSNCEGIERTYLTYRNVKGKDRVKLEHIIRKLNTIKGTVRTWGDNSPKSGFNFGGDGS